MKYIKAWEEQYREKVSFKAESLLILIASLIPFCALITLIAIIDTLTLPSELIAIIFKTGLIIIGMMAWLGTFATNTRHAYLSCMAQIVTGTSTAKTILETAEGKGINSILYFAGYAFYFCIIFSELSIEYHFVASDYGQGIASTMITNFTAPTLDTSRNMLLNGIGARYSCQACAGMWSENVLLVPVSTSLKEVDKSTSSSLSLNADQDILGLEVTCFKMFQAKSVAANHYTSIV
ncbi:hypothetical protein HDU91_004554, partial [Kappamyces sp. JEL0680]